VNFAAITLYVTSQLVFIIVVDFVIDSVRKLLDTPSYQAQNRDQWRDVLKMIMNLRVS
jgi:hypothetical protein